MNTIFNSLGEQLQSIVKAGSHGMDRVIDPRLDEIQRRAALGGSEKVPADGGFLIAPEFVPMLIERMYNVGQVLSRCSEVPVSSSNSLRFAQFDESSRANGSRLGGVRAYWADEAAAATASKPKFQLSELTMHKLICLVYTTDEIARDAASLEVFTRQGFATEMAFTLENAIVTGSGTNQPLGILNSNALIKIAKENNQTAATVNGSNVVNAVTRLWAASRPNAVWLCNGELLSQLQALTVVAAGGSERRLYHFAEGGETFDRLAGFPLLPSEYCPTVGSVGDLILADFSRYIVAMREQRAEVSIHVNFLSDEQVFKFVMRVDGQPIDRSAVTPLNGTLSTSPFVTIDTRS
jgi:HK97 family phage major capsid protein